MYVYVYVYIYMYIYIYIYSNIQYPIYQAKPNYKLGVSSFFE